MFGRQNPAHESLARLSQALDDLSKTLAKSTDNRNLAEKLDRLSKTAGETAAKLNERMAGVGDRVSTQISESNLYLADQLRQFFAETSRRLDENLGQLGESLGRDQLRAAERVALALEALQQSGDSVDSRVEAKLGGPLPVGTAESPVRIAFLFQSASLWSSWKSLWRACEADPRVKPVLVLTTHSYPDRELTLLDEARSMLIREGIGFVTAEAFRLEKFLPHVVFVQTPYADSLPAHLGLDSISRSGARLAYVPYGLEIGGGGFNLQYQFNLPVHQTAWRIFARSERHKRMFAKYCASGSAHVAVTGHPKFDQLVDANESAIDAGLHRTAGDRKIVAWCPHFSVQNPPAWSTFTLYGETILAAIAERPDLYLVIRPHPLLFSTLRNQGHWTAADEEAFRARIAAMDNCELDERDNYLTTFVASSAMMTDAGSFVLEYLATGKPLLYLVHPDGIGLNDDADIADVVDTARKAADISAFLDRVADGKDVRAKARKVAIPEYIGDLDGKIGERIRDHIVAALSSGAVGAPARVEAGEAHAAALNYWGKSTNTYLAPADYYDRQEAALTELLKPLTFKTALDVGCSDGRFTRIIAKHCEHAKGIDVSPDLIAKAKASAKEADVDAEFAVESIEDVKTCGTYDLVACMGVTSGLIDTLSFVRTVDLLAAMVRPDGFLVMKDSLSLAADRLNRADGYVARYRNQSAYEAAFARRGLMLQSRVELSRLPDWNVVNNLYLFKKS